MIAAFVAAASLVGGPSSSGQQAETPPYDVEIIRHETPAVLSPGITLHVPLTLRNAGSLDWDPESQFKISYRWLLEQGEIMTPGGLRTPLAFRVASGEQVEVEARLEAPREPGRYLLRWDVVHEHVLWASQVDPTPLQPIPVEVAEEIPTHAMTILSHTTPRRMRPNGTYSVAIEVRNDGLRTWSPDQPISLSYHWMHKKRETPRLSGPRTRIPEVTAHDQIVRIEAVMRAPTRAGRYQLQWDMVEENVCWFSQRDPSPEQVLTVTVLPTVTPVHLSFLALLLLTALTAVTVTRQDRAPSWLLGSLACGDVLWLITSLYAKQWVVLQNGIGKPDPRLPWTTLTGVAVFACLVLLSPRRLRWITAWLAVALVSLVILADVVYLRFFGDVPSIAALAAAGQAGTVAESAASLLSRADLWLLADLLASLPLLAMVRRLQETSTRRPALGLALVLILLMVPGAVALRSIIRAPKGPFVQVFRNSFQVQMIGVLNFHIYDLVDHVRATWRRTGLDAEGRQRIDDWLLDSRSRRAGTGPSFAAAEGKNLIMLQVESLQSFVVGLEVEGQKVTPNLNRWRDRALWFSKTMDQTAQGRTSDAELLSQVSLLPARKGSASFRFRGHPYVGLAEVLHRRGYATLSAVPFDSDFWNRRILHPAFGYRENLFRSDFDLGVKVGWGLNDRDFLRQMLPRLESMPEPFCSYLITLSNHHPFNSFPDELKDLDLGALEGTALGNYFHSMRFFDRAVGEFIGELGRRGLLERSVVALWGDHVAGFRWSPELAETVGGPHGEGAVHLAASIPLFVYVPGSPHLRGERSMRSGLVDVAPTLLALLGVDPGELPYIGRNLLGNPGSGPVIRPRGVWLNDELLSVNKGLEPSLCIELDTTQIVPAARCRDLNEDALRQLDVSDAIREYGLQSDLDDSQR